MVGIKRKDKPMKDITELQKYLESKDFSQLFILVDENTSKHCLPALLEKVDILTDNQAILLEIPQGEENKNFATVENFIASLQQSNADRNACLICLGGGVICDLGGFAASIYKRGIARVNIPTTLLAMIDAAIGGKTAVDFNGVKNLVGTFDFNYDTFLDTEFLISLSQNQLMDCVAEMLKTFLFSDENLAYEFIQAITTAKTFNTSTQNENTATEELNSNIEYLNTETENLIQAITPFIIKCATIKQDIVKQDSKDNNIRRKLNFGHTLGHAVEVFYNLSHGHAVAVGISYALDLSVKYCGFPLKKAAEIKTFIADNYSIPPFKDDMKSLIPLMQQDKKNSGSNINFVLLKDVGVVF